jgi:hypothetical protein
MSITTTRAGIAAIALAAGTSLGLASAGLAGEHLPRSNLTAADEAGVPAGFTAEEWLAASGEAEVAAQEDGQDVIEFQGSGLVPEGLYTFWWVSDRLIGMDMGPGGGVPDNEFTADAEGHAATTIRVPSDNTYEMMVVAYHADGQTHGESPGEMGSETFEHLKGPWPGPAGEMPN